MASRKHQKEEARARRLALEQQLRAAVARQRRVRRAGATLAAVAALGIAAILIATAASSGDATGSMGSESTAGSVGPEGVPIANGPQLAAPRAPAGGQAVDGISCLAGEQLLFHIHAHLTLLVDGAPRQIPAGIGIVSPQSNATPEGPFVAGGSCFYWLHTHAADGIIHIESPAKRIYTLGDFFDIWGQPLSRNQLGPLRGSTVAFYNGRRFAGDPREIPLTRQAQIQLELGSPLVSPTRISFPAGL